MGWVYRVGTILVTALLRILFHFKVSGHEHIPQGGCLVVSRHRSYWDILLMIAAFGPAHQIHFVARRSLLRNPILYPFLKAYAVTIDRERFRTGDLKLVLQAIDAGRIVAIYPEGTTRPTGRVRTGVIRFAERTGQPLLPLNLAAEGPYPPKYPFHFPRIHAVIGRPFTLAELAEGLDGAEAARERYRMLADRLMKAVDAAEPGGD